MAWLVLALLPGALGAQARPSLDPSTPLTQLNVDLWTEDDGLPQNMAADLVQTPDGYLWIGTEEGLVRFDGVRFRTYGTDETGASTPWVRALWADPDGTLWVGTGGGGMLRMSGGDFTLYTTAEGLAHDHVRAIFRDRDGTLWVGTNGGVSRMVDGGFETLDTDDGLSSDFVLAIYQDRGGDVWVGTMDGLNRVRPDGIDVYRTGDGLASDRVNAVLGARDGSLWIGTTDGGLSRWADGAFTTLSTEDGLSNDYVTSLWEDGAGTLWVGTNGGGVNRVRDGRVSSLGTGDNLPGDLVLSLTGDQEGGVWMGLTGVGLARLRDGMFDNLGRPEGLSADIALAMAEDADGALWIGTAGGGINRVEGDSVATWTTADGLGHDVVLSVAPARGGGAWVGMAAGGLSRVRDGRVTTYGPGDGVAATQVTAVAEDAEGAVWLGTPGQGLQRWRPGPPVMFTSADGLPGDYVTALLPTRDGALWVGTQEGLARLEGGSVRVVPLAADESPSNSVTGLFEDADGTLWVATHRGLGRVRGDEAVHFGPDLHPLLGEVHGVVTDTLGYVWIGSNEGVARVAAAALDTAVAGGEGTLPIRLFGRADGLRSAEVNGGVSPSALRDRAGNVWFPTMKGAVMVEPGDVPEARPTPTAVVESALTGESTWPVSGSISLPPENRTFQLHFTAPTLVAPHEVAFRYMLEGFDEEWVEAGARRVAYYTNVPPGDYTFRVATRRADGPWSESEAALPVTLEHRFHETTPFRVLAGLLLVGMIGTGYRVRVRSLERREDELLRLIEEREAAQRALRQREEELRQSQKMEAVGRLAGGVAHDFNNLLTAISGRTDVVLDTLPEEEDLLREDMEEIRRAARRAADLTQQLLTFSRRRIYQPEVVDPNHLIRDTERMLRRLVREDVALETALDPDVGRVRVDPGALEQILVNFVVNAQDAMPDGGEILIETRRTERGTGDEGTEWVVLAVADTGHGMDPETLEQAFDPFFTTKPVGKGTGLGLSTVYGIVKECGGDVRVTSTPGEGSRFEVLLPRVDEPGTPRAAERPARAAEGGSERVLLVEDDDSVRVLTRKILERKGYTVEDFASPVEALESFRRNGEGINLLISDVVMPGLGGRELAERVTAIRPDVGVLLMSGYNEDEVLRRGVHESGMAFLQKPFETTELVRRVREILDGPGFRA